MSKTASLIHGWGGGKNRSPGKGGELLLAVTEWLLGCLVRGSSGELNAKLGSMVGHGVPFRRRREKKQKYTKLGIVEEKTLLSKA